MNALIKPNYTVKATLVPPRGMGSLLLPPTCRVGKEMLILKTGDHKDQGQVDKVPCVKTHHLPSHDYLCQKDMITEITDLSNSGSDTYSKLYSTETQELHLFHKCRSSLGGTFHIND